MTTKTALAKPTGRSAVEGTTNVTDVKPLLAKIAAKVEGYRKSAEAFIIRTDEDAAKAATEGREVAELGESIERQRREIVDPFNAQVKKINGDFKASSNPLAQIANMWRVKIGAYNENQRKIAVENARKRQIEVNLANASLFDLTDASGTFTDIVARWEERSKVKVVKKGNVEVVAAGETLSPLSAWERTQLETARARLKVVRAEAKKYEKAVEKAVINGADEPPPPAETPKVEVQAAEPAKQVGTASVQYRWTFKERTGEKDTIPVEFMVVDPVKVNSAIRDAVREKRIDTFRIPGLDIEKKPVVAL